MKKVVLYVLLIIMAILLNSAFAQEKSRSERWIQGHVTAFSKDTISVDGIKYQIDPFVTITDSKGNTLGLEALRGVEIVKVLVIDGKVKKIEAILFRM
ncbi:MAG: hypothetical protein AB1478_04250 [Nitrospirota bacterium]